MIAKVKIFLFRHVCFFSRIWPHELLPRIFGPSGWNFSNEPKAKRRPGNRAHVKSPYISKTTILQVHHTFFYISLPTTTWMCLIPRFVEDGNRKQQLSFSFPELWYSPLELDSTPKKFANIWRIKRGRIRVIKFKAASIHFWSHVFVTVRL